MSFKEISPEQAWEMVQNGAMLADIRDPQRFTYSHAKGAFHLTNQSFLQFEEQVDFDSPIIVSCYHGVSAAEMWRLSSLSKAMKMCLASLGDLMVG